MNEELKGWKFVAVVAIGIITTIIYIGETTGLVDGFINSFN